MEDICGKCRKSKRCPLGIANLSGRLEELLDDHLGDFRPRGMAENEFPEVMVVVTGCSKFKEE